MGRVSRDARLLFVELWTICDDSGRTRAASRMLASLLFPYDDDAPSLIDGWLGELERENCLSRYEVDGNTYLQIHNWLNHQKIDKPSASKIPAFENIREDSPNAREKLPRIKEGIKEGNGVESSREESSPVELSDIAIPLDDGSEHPVSLADIAEYRKAYPAVDVLAELRKARAWSVSNPTKRKTRRGVAKFLNAWVSRAAPSATTAHEDRDGSPASRRPLT